MENGLIDASGITDATDRRRVEKRNKKKTKEVKQWLEQHFILHDNATYFNNKTIKKFSEDHGLWVYPSGTYTGFSGGYPGYRPDMNWPAERVVAQVKEKTAQLILERHGDVMTMDPRVIASLMQEALGSIEQTTILKYIRSVSKICVECIQAKGDYGATARGVRLPKSVENGQQSERVQE